MGENRRPRDPEAVKAYERERELAQKRVIERSMNRRLGRFSRVDAADLPPRADNKNYDPRKW